MTLRSPARTFVPPFVALLLAIEFLDELVFGAREAAWPLVRDDLGLDYARVGLLLGLPNIASAVAEPVLGLMGDTRWRSRVIVVGGVAFAVALAAFAVAPAFGVLLVASLLLYPASGAFVSLSQVALVASNPARGEQLMARWTLAGSIGVVLGPLLLGGAVLAGLGWRGAFAVGAIAALVFALLVARAGGTHVNEAQPKASFRDSLRGVKAAVRRRSTWRWLVLLGFSDLMLDVFLGFLALYVVDVAHGSSGVAGTAVLVWSAVGLAGDALLLPLLERVAGVRYLRWSARLMLFVFPAFLLVPALPAKLVLLGAMGLLNAGWYAILKAQLYASLPGQPGAAMAVYGGFTSVTGLAPALLGVVAQQWGLEAAMWLLLAGPVALIVGLHRPPALAPLG